MDFLTDPFLVDPGRFDAPVLVTGAGGCIGSWTVAALARSGVPVVACDLTDDRRRPAMLLGEDRAAALDWENVDVTDAARLASVVEAHGVGAIIHLAGLQIPFCRASPALGARVNVEGTINVLEVARTQGLRRLAFASSTAALGMPPGGDLLATLYGAYKTVNEHTAKVYHLDWGVPSVGIRPNVVYGPGRDQGITAAFTIGIAKSVTGEAHAVPYSGPLSWLFAGEAASAFIAAVAEDRDSAEVFNLNGPTHDVEAALAVMDEIMPGHRITIAGDPLGIPQTLDDGPLHALVGDYPSVSLEDGLGATLRAFEALQAEGRLLAAT